MRSVWARYVYYRLLDCFLCLLFCLSIGINLFLITSTNPIAFLKNINNPRNRQSAVVLALVVTNPAPAADVATEQEVRSHVNEINSHDRKRGTSISAFDAQKGKEYDELCRKMDSGIWSDDECNRRDEQFNNKKQQERYKLLRTLKEKHTIDRIKLKTTVILTSLSLIGQWYVQFNLHHLHFDLYCIS